MSSVRNIIKQFQESEEISVRMGDGQKKLLLGCPGSSGPSGKHRHGSLMEITASAQEHYKSAVHLIPNTG